MTQREKTQVMPVVHKTRNLAQELFSGESGSTNAKISQFIDFLDKIHVLDPAKRPSLNWCLSHPFITEK